MHCMIHAGKPVMVAPKASLTTIDSVCDLRFGPNLNPTFVVWTLLGATTRFTRSPPAALSQVGMLNMPEALTAYAAVTGIAVANDSTHIW